MSKDDIPKSKMARMTVAGKTAATMGSKKAQFLMKKALASKGKKQKLEQTHNDEMAEILFKGLSKLRGTALKIAQSICAETGALPAHYLEKLEKSCYQVPPLNRAVVRKVIKDSLGDEPENIFQSFEHEAFAAASLGQAHKAIGRNGEALAVKVQYPGIGDTIQSDLKLAKGMLAPLRQNKLAKQTFAEIKSHLEDETDYEKELKNTQWFSENIKIEGIRFPKTFPQYSGSKVLSTEYIDGKHLNDWLKKNPPQEFRNRAAKNLWKFFWTGLNQHQIIHSDPNLGNFLFHDDGSITVIDFGSIKKPPKTEIEVFNLLWKPQTPETKEAVTMLYQKLGANFEEKDRDQFYQDMILPYCQWRDNLPEQFKKDHNFAFQAQQILNQSAFEPRMQNFSTQFTMLHRALFGLIQVFQKLEAQIELNESTQI